MSGIVQFLAKRGEDELVWWCDEGYKFLKTFDNQLSEEFGVPASVKITSIKPSGTVSLLAGATPGVHFPISQFYIWRVRLASNSSLLGQLQKKGLPSEPDHYSQNTFCVEIPIDLGPISTLEHVDMEA